MRLTSTHQLAGLKGMAIYQQAGIQHWDYDKVHAMARVVADQLIEAYGEQGVKSLSYSAIPRGGYIVFGILSYYLDLSPDSFHIKDDDSPIVIVDDCGLSGRRFGEFIGKFPRRKIIFAHLTSHPNLRKAIMESEARVVDVIAGCDIVDVGPTLFPQESEYRAWCDHWSACMGGKQYWTGVLQAFTFPWGEPNRYYWNSDAERFENDWFFLSPDRAAKNAHRFGLPAITNGARQLLRCPDSVAYKLASAKHTILCDFLTNEVFDLSDIGSDIWRCLVVYGREDTSVAYLQEKYEASLERITADVRAFANDLIQRQLVENIEN